jgi:hypothetical protein
MKKTRAQARALQAAIRQHRHATRATLKDLQVVLNCSMAGDFEPAHATTLYQRDGAAYCACLELLDKECG